MRGSLKKILLLIIPAITSLHSLEAMEKVALRNDGLISMERLTECRLRNNL